MSCINSWLRPLRGDLIERFVVKSWGVRPGDVRHRYFGRVGLRAREQVQGKHSSVGKNECVEDEEIDNCGKTRRFAGSSVKEMRIIVKERKGRVSEADHAMTTMASELWLLMLAAVLGCGSIGAFLWFSAVDITMENFICGMKFAIRDGYDQNMKLVLNEDVKEKEKKPAWVCDTRFKPP